MEISASPPQTTPAQVALSCRNDAQRVGADCSCAARDRLRSSPEAVSSPHDAINLKVWAEACSKAARATASHGQAPTPLQPDSQPLFLRAGSLQRRGPLQGLTHPQTAGARDPLAVVENTRPPHIPEPAAPLVLNGRLPSLPKLRLRSLSIGQARVARLTVRRRLEVGTRGLLWLVTPSG